MSWKEKRKREREQVGVKRERMLPVCFRQVRERERELVSRCLKRLLRLISTERVDCLVC